jgi:cation transport regulator ChaC
MSLDEPQSVWIFGYGSLIWGTGAVETAERLEGFLEGWRRDHSRNHIGKVRIELSIGEETKLKGLGWEVPSEQRSRRPIRRQHIR